MPELPDVEVFKQSLDATALHQRIAKTSVPSPKVLRSGSAARLARALKGQQFRSSHRHGKFLFVALDRKRWLVFHFGMTGFLKYFKNAADAPSHTCVLIDFDSGDHLAYDSMRKLGAVHVTDSVEAFVQQRELGPDALDPRLDLAAFAAIMGQTRRTVKSALMNQRLIAGIGNIYSDEILSRAGIHPGRKSYRLGDAGLKRLHTAMKTVLRKAIECRVDPKRFPDSYLLPHRVGDGRCPRCGRKLKHKKFSGRTAYYCPRDQRKGG